MEKYIKHPTIKENIEKLRGIIDRWSYGLHKPLPSVFGMTHHNVSKAAILVRVRREIYRQIKYFRDEKATRRF